MKTKPGGTKICVSREAIAFHRQSGAGRGSIFYWSSQDRAAAMAEPPDPAVSSIIITFGPWIEALGI